MNRKYLVPSRYNNYQPPAFFLVAHVFWSIRSTSYGSSVPRNCWRQSDICQLEEVMDISPRFLFGLDNLHGHPWLKGLGAYYWS